MAEDEGDEIGSNDSQQRSESRANQPFQRCFPDLDFEQNDDQPNHQAGGSAIGSGKIEGTQEPGCC